MLVVQKKSQYNERRLQKGKNYITFRSNLLAQNKSVWSTSVVPNLVLGDLQVVHVFAPFQLWVAKMWTVQEGTGGPQGPHWSS